MQIQNSGTFDDNNFKWLCYETCSFISSRNPYDIDTVFLDSVWHDDGIFLHLERVPTKIIAKRNVSLVSTCSCNVKNQRPIFCLSIIFHVFRQQIDKFNPLSVLLRTISIFHQFLLARFMQSYLLIRGQCLSKRLKFEEFE